MISLLMVAAFGQCASRGYGYSYARPAYTYSYAAPATTYYQAPAQQYAAPAVNYSLVGDYLRQESAYKASVEQNAKLDVLIKLLAERPAPPPVQQFQQPAPQPQYYSTPQQPSKAPPEQPYQPQPSQQYPSQQYPSQQQPYAPQEQPSYGTKPQPNIPAPPSFESSSWVPPPPQSSGGGVAAMVGVMQNRCVDCHVGTSEKGGGVKLLELDGQLADISPYLGPGAGGIEQAVTSGRMPKKGPRLSNQELYGILSGLREYAATSRARANVMASFGQ